MLIFFDIDGTLIDETHLMSESTKEAIQRARANGHICMINTGRSLKLVGEDITGQTEFDGLALGCGTMLIYRGKVLMQRTFDEEASRRIIDGLRRHHIDAVLEGSENNFNDSTENIFSKEFEKFISRFDKQNYGSYEDAVGHFDKFYAYAENREYMDAFRAEFEKELDFVDREKDYFEIMPKGCSKASAIEFMAEYLNISMNQTVAIGDCSNDAPMIERAHIGIAMGNATEDIKQMADFITTDVDKDGIANALKWLNAFGSDTIN